MRQKDNLLDDAGLAGKVAIVTGGGAAGDGIGNGRAAAILLARAGTRVLVVDRRHGMGCGLRCAVSPIQSCPLHHRTNSGCRWRSDAGRTGQITQFTLARSLVQRSI